MTESLYDGRQTVAVIGLGKCLQTRTTVMRRNKQQKNSNIPLGVMGIVTVKNLLEEEFKVTGFEKSGYIGGLWHYTDDPNTLSALPSMFRL